MRASVNTPMPVWPKMPSPSIFVPLVFLLAASVPAWSLWGSGALTLDQSVWGLSGLDALRGNWWSPGLGNVTAPPLYAWSMAAALKLPFANKLSVLLVPAYVYALLSLFLVYHIGRKCFSPGIGLVACFLYSANQSFLAELHRGGSTMCILFLALLSVAIYLQHAAREDVVSGWTIVGMFTYACLLLSAGLFALWIPLMALLDDFYRQTRRYESYRSAFQHFVRSPVVLGGITIVAGGMALSAPWLLRTTWTPGPYAPWNVSAAGSAPSVPFTIGLVNAMPATVVLALLGLWRMFRQSIRGGRSVEKVEFIVLWTLIAALALGSYHPTPEALLFTVAPLTILAVQTLFAMMQREIRDRETLLVMLGVAWIFVASHSQSLQELPQWLMSESSWSAEQKLSLHIACECLLGVTVLVAGSYVASSRDDKYRRMMLGTFVVMTTILTCVPDVRQFSGTSRNEDPWSRIYQNLARVEHVSGVIYLGSEAPNPSLQFVVQSLFPDLPKAHVHDRSEFENYLRQSNLAPLVLVTDVRQRMQSQRTLITKDDRPITLAQVYDDRDRVIAYAPTGVQGGD